MKSHITNAIMVAAILLSLAVVVQAQNQPSIDDQIKQKETELERLRAIKRRQEQIRQLEGEIRRLQNNESLPDKETALPGASQVLTSPTSAKSEAPPKTAETTPATPNETSSPTFREPPVEAVSRTFVAGEAATSDLPALRSCIVVKSLSDEAVNAGRPDPTSLLERYVCRTVSKIKRNKLNDPSAGLDLRADFFPLMITLLAREGRAQYVLAAEEESVDTQVGSDASSSGSTSLVTKGSVPAILGFAVDSGGLLKSSNGSALTFRGNVAGLAKAIAGKGFISGYDEDSAATRFLRRTAFAFTFDTSRGDEPGVFIGSKQQISNYSVHFDIYNKRDPREKRYRDEWKRFLSGVSQQLVTQIQSSLTTLGDPTTNTWNDPALQAWYVLTNNAIHGAKVEEVEGIFLEQLAKAPKNLSDATTAELRSFDKSFKEWMDAREGILDKIAKAPILSFEYINDRPLNAPTLSKFNLIAEFGFGPKLDLTFNGALTMFNERPALGVNRVRDYQFATQLDVPFGEVGLGMGKPVLSFAGRWERLMTDATSSSGITVPNTQGDIGVGQIKLVIPIKGSGVRIPLSLSFANRTELIREREVRGNFGFTFDLDTLFSKFKPF